LKDKQEAENRDKQKDADKLRDKFEKFGFTDIPLGAQGTWREGYIQALLDAKKEGRSLDFAYNFVDTFTPSSPEEFLQHLKPLVESKMAELKASSFFNSAPDVETDQPSVETEIKTEAQAESAPVSKPKKKKKSKKPAAEQASAVEVKEQQPAVALENSAKPEPLKEEVKASQPTAASMFEGDDDPKEDVDMQTQELELTED
jgi:hypothetical protein